MRTSVVRAVAAALLFAAVVMTGSAYQPPEYEAIAVVLVGQKTKEVHPGIHPIPNVISSLQDVTETVAKAVPTMPIARASVERLNLPNGSARQVLENMSVEQEPRTMFIDITYRDSEAKRAQLVANAIGQVLSQKIGEASLGKSRITATLWQPAKVPAAPVSPKPLRNGLIALVAGLAISAVLVAVAHR